MFKTFLTLTIGCTVCLFALGFFAKYVKESIRIRELQMAEYNQSLKPKNSVVTPVDLAEAQRRVLGYKDIPLIPWTADQPKPPKAVIHQYSKPETEVECLEDECRWTKIVGD